MMCLAKHHILLYTQTNNIQKTLFVLHVTLSDFACLKLITA